MESPEPLMIGSTADIPVLYSAEVVPFTHKSCHPFAKGSRLPIHLYQGDEAGPHYEAYTKFHKHERFRYGFSQEWAI
jgi:hypothetical protein